MLSELTNGKYFFYRLEEGGSGIVKADNTEQAESKVRDAYIKHSDPTLSERIEIHPIVQKPFGDSPDIMKLYEY